MNILVTGGTGYIGSHTLIQLIEAGHSPVVIDNLSNSSQESIKRVENITGQNIPFYKADVRDENTLDEILTKHAIDSVIHFAGLKAVGESVTKPLHYYRNNIDSTLSLIEAMERRGINQLIFSSSATVYGDPDELPLTEQSRVGVGLTNPYGKTKYMIEEILRDYSLANPQISVTILRYFNPIGAHESGLIGEDPSGTPNNLLPYVSQVAVGKLSKLKIFGDDYDTPDGTGLRDYIHVMDLADGHVAALKHSQPGVATYNLGSGKGVSVLNIVRAFEQASGKEIPYEIVERRPGDVASCYADPSKAEREFSWKTQKTLLQACEDSWRWQSQNPDGYNELI